MLLVRHSIPEATWSDFWLDKLNENFYHQSAPYRYWFQHGKRNWIRQKPRLLDMKFDRALLSIKSSTRFKWAITFDARCLREKPPEKIDGYSHEKERSLGIEKKMIIVYTIIMTMIPVIVKKKTSHNIFFSLMPNNNYLLSPSFYLLLFFKLLVVSRFL